MSRRGRIGLLAALAGVALIGCGESAQDDDPTTMPDDFELRFEHADGSVAPPYHREWTIEVAADGSGTFEYVPDYSGEGVPVYEKDFTVPEAEVAELYTELDSANLLDGRLEEAEDPPIGGSVERALITAEGEQVEVPAFLDSGATPIEPLSDRIEALVPEPVWREFERRADAYARSAESGY